MAEPVGDMAQHSHARIGRGVFECVEPREIQVLVRLDPWRTEECSRLMMSGPWDGSSYANELDQRAGPALTNP